MHQVLQAIEESIHTVTVQVMLGMLMWSVEYTSGHQHVKDSLIQSQVNT